MGYEEEVTLELEPLQGHRRLVDQSLSHAEPTGKGRGSASAGLLGPLQPTEQWLGHGALRAEGKLPNAGTRGEFQRLATRERMGLMMAFKGCWKWNL